MIGFCIAAGVLVAVSMVWTRQAFDPAIGLIAAAVIGVGIPALLWTTSSSDSEYTRATGDLRPTWVKGGDDPDGWVVQTDRDLMLPPGVGALELGAIEYAHRSHVLLAVFHRDRTLLWTLRGYAPEHVDAEPSSLAVRA
jgi:hypothetical protein